MAHDIAAPDGDRRRRNVDGRLRRLAPEAVTPATKPKLKRSMRPGAFFGTAAEKATGRLVAGRRAKITRGVALEKASRHMPRLGAHAAGGGSLHAGGCRLLKAATDRLLQDDVQLGFHPRPPQKTLATSQAELHHPPAANARSVPMPRHNAPALPRSMSKSYLSLTERPSERMLCLFIRRLQIKSSPLRNFSCRCGVTA